MALLRFRFWARRGWRGGVLAVSVLASTAVGDDLRWKAGLAKTVITPKEPIWMAGFAVRTHPSEGVRQDIFVRALALQAEGDAPAVLVTLDLLSVDRATADAIAEGCRQRQDLPRERLALNVSHTHSGPVAGLEIMPMHSDLVPSQQAAVRRYTDELIEKTVATVGEALAALAPAKIEFAQGLAGVAVNRRRVADRSRPGPVDHDVPVLAVSAASGELRGVVVGYATHATAMNDYLISNDWPGFALIEIERLHPGVQAMFVQGCGADANPLPRRDESLARLHGQVLAAAVEQVLAGKKVTLSGPLKAAMATVPLEFQKLPTREELQSRLTGESPYARRHAARLLQMLERDGRLAASYPYPVQVWKFGTGQQMIFLGGEVVVDYSLRLKRQYGFETTWVSGYSNDVMAYIPSERVLQEGGYEGGEAMVYFGPPSAWAPGVEERIVGQVQDLVEALKR